MKAAVRVKLTRLVISIAASVAGVILTAIVWKPGVIVGAALAPVIALFVESSFGDPLLRYARGASDAELPSTPRESFHLAVTTGLIGFAIVGAVLTIPPLVEGDALRDTPLLGGDVPIVAETDSSSGGAAASGGGSDPDGDGLVGTADNCPNVHNPGQEDTNGSGRGDACDPDDDNDGVLDDAPDNCRSVQNAGQEDSDADGEGDACEDRDGDGVVDADDNCPDAANPGQEDLNGDGEGDACDSDIDGDMVDNEGDTEPTNPLVQ